MGAFLTLYTFAGVILLVIHGGLCVDIIGGSEVPPHSRPFMALITRSGSAVCGGALIKENWVLTAAHCEVNQCEVVLGAHSVKRREREKQTFQIKKQIRHPDYKPCSKENDLMLLQLSGRAKINAAVKVIQVPNSGDDVQPGTVCTVAGWGLTDIRRKRHSDTLREVNVTVINRKTCNDAKHYNKNPVITENMICAGDKTGKKDSCKGDSGGPLRCQNVMRGITAFGKPNKCGTADGPGVYTRLTKQYIHWIKKTIRGA
ncbi:PREDICTED: granzyme A-like [Acanthisitta chloris]|uniref:granzyme A-like n=1 Tax=Acanthisitta chloris TaxID=57068 RepID=UPI0004F0E4F7|nr:PREDICTED: granzyme A-like [Acanthisitta chloris]